MKGLGDELTVHLITSGSADTVRYYYPVIHKPPTADEHPT